MNGSGWRSGVTSWALLMINRSEIIVAMTTGFDRYAMLRSTSVGYALLM